MKNRMEDPASAQEVRSFSEFLAVHRRKVSKMINKVLWALIVTGPVVFIGVLVGIFKNVNILAGPIISLFLFSVAFVHSTLIKKRVNVVITSMRFSCLWTTPTLRST